MPVSEHLLRSVIKCVCVCGRCRCGQGVTVRFGSVAASMSWEVALGGAGKTVTLKSGYVIDNQTKVNVQVAVVARNRTVTVVGTAGPGLFPIPPNVPPPAAFVVRPSVGT